MLRNNNAGDVESKKNINNILPRRVELDDDEVVFGDNVGEVGAIQSENELLPGGDLSEERKKGWREEEANRNPNIVMMRHWYSERSALTTLCFSDADGLNQRLLACDSSFLFISSIVKQNKLLLIIDKIFYYQNNKQTDKDFSSKIFKLLIQIIFIIDYLTN